MNTFEARYPGRCASCDERISAGDEVGYVEDELVHADCEDYEPAPERPTVTCEACWLIKPCECD